MTVDPLYGLDPKVIHDAFMAAAAAAATLTLAGFRTPLAVENKLSVGFDPVTMADKDAETAIRTLIGKRFPSHGIIGEEWEPKLSQSRFEWIIDPIDGTRAFICGVPVWGTLIGLMHEGEAIAGLMAQPFTGEMFYSFGQETMFARHGEVATRVRTSGVTEIAAAKLTTTAPELFHAAGVTTQWEAVRDQALTTRYGLDCYGYCLLAAGHIDLVVEAELKNVDIAPLIPIIRHAGGVVTRWDGGPAEAGGNVVAAATPELHRAAMEVLGR